MLMWCIVVYEGAAGVVVRREECGSMCKTCGCGVKKKAKKAGKKKSKKS